MRQYWWMGVIALLGMLAGCAPTSSRRTAPHTRTTRTVQVKGSDTMVNLNQALAESFMAQNRTVRIMVTGGGSGTGITALIQGTTDIAASSRAMSPEEISAADKAGHTPRRFSVALDGIAVIVNPNNAVKTLTRAQLAAIFTGKVTDWKQLGGTPSTIVLLGREVNSGTHVFFKEHVLQQGNRTSTADYARGTRYLASSQAIVSEVSSNVQAIGYVGLGYLDPAVRAVPVAKTAGAKAVAPTPETVRSGGYPISRPLYYYTSGTPKADVQRLLDYVLSPAGQQVVRELEFVPVK